MENNENNVVTFVPKKRLSGAEILSAVDVKTLEVEVPEWGGVVALRSLSAGEALEFAEAIKRDPGFAPVRLLVKCLVDDAGNPLFTEAHLEALKKKSMAVVTRLQDVALDLNGLLKKPEDEKAAAKKG